MIRHTSLLITLLIAAACLTGCSKTYTATAYVMPPLDRCTVNMSEAAIAALAAREYEDFQSIPLEDVLMVALEDETIQATRWYTANQEDVLERLRAVTRVIPEPETCLDIAIHVTLEDPVEATTLANAIAEAYVSCSQVSTATEFYGRIRYLRVEHERLGGEIDELRAALRNEMAQLQPGWDGPYEDEWMALPEESRDLMQQHDTAWLTYVKAENTYLGLCSAQEAGALATHQLVQDVLWSDQDYIRMMAQSLALVHETWALRESDPPASQGQVDDRVEQLERLRGRIATHVEDVSSAILEDHEQAADIASADLHRIEEELAQLWEEIPPLVRSRHTINVLQTRDFMMGMAKDQVEYSIMALRCPLGAALRILHKAEAPTMPN